MTRSREPETLGGGYDAQARHEEVLGDGPRIEALANEDIDVASWDLVNRLRASAGAPPTTDMPGFLRLMAKHSPIFHRQMEMGNVLFNGCISAREREIAVLRIAWLGGAAFEWGEHVEIGKRAGLAAEEIERITQGSAAAGWSVHEAAILRAVEELMADSRICGDTWATLARSWDEQQLIELPMMVGQYLTTAFLLNSLQVQLGEGNLGLAHR